ncbi:tripartite tricarboxylate transporter TctB family protein [Paracoccus sp. TK19116]|uniref:Tripartite tricarboxylate transporter TctB family protein n=1 Tax=Paracoccus albicereus TaxID=2922394 RepID=A0ABT1MUW8_9RHOB|nr:tripartite tricarboxylate transporter TctB family protein [Paracoccus albicereus]MCQ0972095.1 tripartite tricarboxylate transporter TctB family protein [Paracoccus albicereus]
MIVQSAKRRIDWGHLALLVVLAGIVVWYLHDAWSASARVRNLILVLPASILSLVLAAAIAIGVLVRGVDEAEATEDSTTREKLYPLILMAIFGLYILTLPVTGFDVGSALFVLIALMVDGERRPLFLAIYPVAFAAVCTMLFRWLLPYPMTTLIL